MSKLIAVVAVTTLVKGERITFSPGDEVTGLSALDAADLKRQGAVQDPEDMATEAKTVAKLDAAGQREFAAARKLELAKAAASALTLQA